jgi:sugar phosphate permease
MSLRGETSELQTRTMKRVASRLMPALLILYIIAYLDRVNITFAQDKLESDLGFSGAVYGFGAGVFFIAYFFLEVPSDLALHKFGARKWIARIMFTWGISRRARCSCRGRRASTSCASCSARPRRVSSPA